MSQSLKTSSIISLMFQYNLKWHLSVMKDILLRYKILLVFLIAIAAPTIKTLIYAIKFPAVNLLCTFPEKTHLLYSLISFQLLGLIWVAINHAVIYKQSWNKYIASLPISNRQRLIIDSCLLFFLNWILWLSIVIAFVVTLSDALNNIELIILISTKFCLNIVLILLAQIIWMKNNRWLMVILILVDSLLIYFSQVNLPAQLFINSFFIGLSLLLAVLLYRFSNLQSQSVNGFFKLNTYRIKKYREWIISIRIQFNHFLANIEQLSAWIVVLFASLLLAVFFIVYDKNPSSLIFILTISMFFNALLASHLFKHLDLQRNMFVNFLASLPTSKLKIFVIDTVMVFSIMLTINGMIIFLLQCLSPVRISNMIFPLFLSAIFLILTYYPQVKMSRFGSFVSLLIMMMFITVYSW